MAAKRLASCCVSAGAAAGIVIFGRQASAFTITRTPAINAITQAIQALGAVQGVVGAGENKLNYAISLATSQITSFSSAQSQIRDANVAQEAANLSQ